MNYDNFFDALENYHYDKACKMIKEHKPNLNEEYDGYTPLEFLQDSMEHITNTWAAECMIDFMIDHGANPKVLRNYKPSFEEISRFDSIYDNVPINECYPVMYMHLKYSENVNKKGRRGFTALHRANTPELVEYLIESRFNVNAKDKIGMTPLHYMWYDYCINENSLDFYKMARILLKHGADTSGIIADPLFTKYSDEYLVKFLQN